MSDVDSDEYEEVEYLPTKPKPPVTKPKPVATAKQPPVSPSSSSPKAPWKPMPRPKPKPHPKPVTGLNQHPKSSTKPERQSEHSCPSILHQSPSRTSGSVSDDHAPPVPTSPRPMLPLPFQTLPPRRTYTTTFTVEEASKLKRTQSLDESNLARASLSSTSNEESNSHSLGNFVSRHGRSLPLHVRVDKGFSGDQLQYVISAGDEFIIHFIKHRKVISLMDSNAHQYAIPSNSPIEVAPLYNPNNNTSEALKGFTFVCAADIAALQSPLPKCVRVTRSYQGSDSKCSVEEGEILIVKKASRTSVKRKPVLKVFSITKDEEKSLNEDCAGHFTTQPDDARLLLMQAIQHIPDLFPMEAKIYMKSDVPEVPNHLSSEVITFTHSSIETLLIATPYCEENTSPSEEDSIPVEIPIYLDIDVSVVPSQDQEAKTKDTTTSSKSEAQPPIHQIVKLGNKRRNTEIARPTPIHDTSHRVSQTPPSSPNVLKASAKASVVIKDTPVKSGETTSASTDELAALQSSTKSLKTAVDTFRANSDKQFSSIQDELARMAPIIDNLLKRCNSTEENLKRLEQLVMASMKQQQHGSAAATSDVSTEEQNRDLMRSLNHIQVLELLTAMNLQEYQDAFKSEQINGDVLVECDETVLEHELGITSKLHRFRLMKLITGQHSVAVFLESQDPYVEVKKK